MDRLDELLKNKANESKTEKPPENILDMLERIFEHNNGLSLTSRKRVTVDDAIKLFSEEGFTCTKDTLNSIARNIFDRRSFAREQ